MNASDTKNKRFKRPKQKTSCSTNPEASKPEHVPRSASPPLCPLLAKDSEWVDILQNPLLPDEPSTSAFATGVSHEEEAILQLVECEDGPQLKPLAIMFPDLIEKDPQTLEGVLNKAMSTTEVTKHLVDLGQKANFTFMKKASRLIPREKQWLEKVMEDNTSRCSLNINSSFYNSTLSSDYDADTEVAEEHYSNTTTRKRRGRKLSSDMRFNSRASQDTLDGMERVDERNVQEMPNKDELNISIAKGSARCSKRLKRRRKKDTNK